jgi:hypothetical protein
MRHVMSVNLGFGGSNAALIFSNERIMKIDLAIIGQGAVSPRHRRGIAFVIANRSPVPTVATSRAGPDQRGRCCASMKKIPPSQRWQREPRLRRASPITLFPRRGGGAGAGRRRKRLARRPASSSRFPPAPRLQPPLFRGHREAGAQDGQPGAFPETVFNSPGSHVAAVLGLNGAAYALVGDETAWVAALRPRRCG